MLKRQVLGFSEPVFLGVLNYLYLLSLIPYLLTENDNFLLDNREERKDKGEKYKRKRQLSCRKLSFSFGADDRGRTGTGISSHGILSPGRLPIPPHRHVTYNVTTDYIIQYFERFVNLFL